MKTEARCPACLSPVEQPFYCPGCRRAYHEACYRQNRCVLDDCASRVRKKPKAPAEPASSHLWTRAGYFSLAFLTWWGITYMLARGPSHPVTRGCLAFLSVISIATFGTLTAAALHELAMRHGDGRRPDFVGTMGVAAHLAWMTLITLTIFVNEFLFQPGRQLSDLTLQLGGLLVGLGFLFGLVGVFVDSLKTRATNVTVTGLLLGMLGAIAIQPYPRRSERANTRACYANQKTVLGAIEMYDLDHRTHRVPLDAAFFTALKSGGYLQSMPQDPGEGPGTSGHYQWSPSGPGNGMRCTVHDSIQ